MLWARALAYLVRTDDNDLISVLQRIVSSLDPCNDRVLWKLVMKLLHGKLGRIIRRRFENLKKVIAATLRNLYQQLLSHQSRKTHLLNFVEQPITTSQSPRTAVISIPEAG